MFAIWGNLNSNFGIYSRPLMKGMYQYILDLIKNDLSDFKEGEPVNIKYI